MTRKDFLGKAGRWVIMAMLLAGGGFLMASRRIAFRTYCASNSNCKGCGLNRVCNPPAPIKSTRDEKE